MQPVTGFFTGYRLTGYLLTTLMITTSSSIDVARAVVPFSDNVKLLGVRLDSALTMDQHVTEVLRSCTYHTRALRHIRPQLTLDVAKMVGQHRVVAHCCMAHQQTTLTGRRWHRTCWPEWCVRLHVPPVPPVSYTHLTLPTNREV